MSVVRCTCLYALLFIPRRHAMAQNDNGLLSWNGMTAQACGSTRCGDVHAASVEGTARRSFAWNLMIPGQLLSFLTVIALFGI